MTPVEHPGDLVGIGGGGRAAHILHGAVRAAGQQGAHGWHRPGRDVDDELPQGEVVGRHVEGDGVSVTCVAVAPEVAQRPEDGAPARLRVDADVVLEEEALHLAVGVHGLHRAAVHADQSSLDLGHVDGGLLHQPCRREVVVTVVEGHERERVLAEPERRPPFELGQGGAVLRGGEADEQTVGRGGDEPRPRDAMRFAVLDPAGHRPALAVTTVEHCGGLPVTTRFQPPDAQWPRAAVTAVVECLELPFVRPSLTPPAHVVGRLDVIECELAGVVERRHQPPQAALGGGDASAHDGAGAGSRPGSRTWRSWSDRYPAPRASSSRWVPLSTTRPALRT